MICCCCCCCCCYSTDKTSCFVLTIKMLICKINYIILPTFAKGKHGDKHREVNNTLYVMFRAEKGPASIGDS